MRESRRKIILIIIVTSAVIAALFGIYKYFGKINREMTPLPPGVADINDRELPPLPSNPPNSSGFPVAPDETVKLPPYKGRAIAVINEDKIVVSTFPDDVKNKLKSELLELAASLAKNPDTLEGWLRAGVIKKFFGDYEGSRDLWEYASLIRPKNSTSFFNLGGLYAFYLKDFAKAELNYKIALGNAPADVYIYTALADLYRYSLPEKSGEIPTVILRGIEAAPENAGLLMYLASYYKEKGDTAKALEYYGRVLVLDPKNTAAKAEITALKK